MFAMETVFHKFVVDNADYSKLHEDEGQLTLPLLPIRRWGGLRGPPPAFSYESTCSKLKPSAPIGLKRIYNEMSIWYLGRSKGENL